MATSTKTAKSADTDKPFYELKVLENSSDGLSYDEHRYPEGFVVVREDHEKRREWLTKLASMFSDFVGLDKSMWSIATTYLHSLDSFRIGLT